MEIVEDDDERLITGSRGKEPSNCLEEPEPCLLGLKSGTIGDDVREQLAQLGEKLRQLCCVRTDASAKTRSGSHS